MENDTRQTLPVRIQKVVDDFLPLIRKLELDRYALTIGGSVGKGTWTDLSDIDFRLYYDPPLSEAIAASDVWSMIDERIAWWKEQGVAIDGMPLLAFADFEKFIDVWLSGDDTTFDLVWTIWGFYPIPNLLHQIVIEDPADVIDGWKRRLTIYPQILKAKIISRHLESLRYWAGDYHYANKAIRGDAVFLAGLSSRLVHELIQVLFALNETWYVGDGSNLGYIEAFPLKPDRVTDRITSVLYPAPGDDIYRRQRHDLLSLIADVERLLPEGT